MHIIEWQHSNRIFSAALPLHANMVLFVRAVWYSILIKILEGLDTECVEADEGGG